MPEPDPGPISPPTAGGALQSWAASGAMALTGRPAGPPLAAPGGPAEMIAESLGEIAASARERTGRDPGLPGIELLGERAATTGLHRGGPFSCGGAFRVVETNDGRLGLSLPRLDDLEMIPALIESEPGPDAWAAVAAWARTLSTSEAADRVRLLGLAGGAVPDPQRTDRPGVLVTEYGQRRHRRERPRIIDLTSLWAGPLCAHLLGLTGAEVVKVESVQRPDGARRGPAAFFDLLHGGQSMVALDFHDPRGIATLQELIAEADLVLESSRPRALAQFGMDAVEVVAAGTSWLSITARGRGSNSIGFGDDVAATAGLVVPDGSDLLPCGDALADPLAGVAATAAATAALAAERARLIDVSMLHVAAEAAAGAPEEHRVHRGDDGWWVETADGRFRVADPVARRPTTRAGALGADNERWVGTP